MRIPSKANIEIEDLLFSTYESFSLNIKSYRVDLNINKSKTLIHSIEIYVYKEITNKLIDTKLYDAPLSSSFYTLIYKNSEFEIEASLLVSLSITLRINYKQSVRIKSIKLFNNRKVRYLCLSMSDILVIKNHYKHNVRCEDILPYKEPPKKRDYILIPNGFKEVFERLENNLFEKTIYFNAIGLDFQHTTMHFIKPQGDLINLWTALGNQISDEKYKELMAHWCSRDIRFDSSSFELLNPEDPDNNLYKVNDRV